MQKRLKSFLIVFLFMQSITTPISAYYYRYQLAPIVRYQRTDSASEAAALVIVAVGVILCVVISEWLNSGLEKKRFREYTEIFKKLIFNSRCV